MSSSSDQPAEAFSRQEQQQREGGKRGLFSAGASSSSDRAPASQQQDNQRRPNRTPAPQHPEQQRQRSSRGQQLPALLLATCVFALSLPAARALTCYETINGKTTIKQNDTWQYCALMPATMRGSELINGSQFGLGPENDMLGAYNSAFGMSMEDYRILTVCIYERYDFTRYMPIKPAAGAVEFAFRCVCNYDLCNSETTFSAYLTAIKADSYALAATDTAEADKRR